MYVSTHVFMHDDAQKYNSPVYICILDLYRYVPLAVVQLHGNCTNMITSSSLIMTYRCMNHGVPVCVGRTLYIVGNLDNVHHLKKE